MASGCLVGTSLEPLPRPVCRWEAGWEARRHAAPSASVGAPPRAQRAVRPRPPTSKALQFCGVLGGSHPSWRRASLRGRRMGFSYFSFAILMTASFAWRCGTDLPSRLPELSHGLWVLSLGLPALPPHFGRLALLPPSPARQGPGLHGNGDALPGTHPTSSGAPDGRTSRLRGGKGRTPSPLSFPTLLRVSPDPPGFRGPRRRGPNLVIAASGWLAVGLAKPRVTDTGRGRASAPSWLPGSLYATLGAEAGPTPGSSRLPDLAGGGLGGGGQLSGRGEQRPLPAALGGALALR